MPKEIKDGDMKTFLLYLRGDDKTKVNRIGKSITIKTKNRKTKFKLRCPRYVYTLKVDEEKNDKSKNEIVSQNHYNQKVFELINQIRLNPPGYSQTILDNINNNKRIFRK